tara:strand:- start:1269 stop:1415 length:147 start_codon:yes stop_codon:yes gene_type:complete
MTPKTKNKPITGDFSCNRLLSLGLVLYNVVTIWRTGKNSQKKRGLMPL